MSAAPSVRNSVLPFCLKINRRSTDHHSYRESSVTSVSASLRISAIAVQALSPSY